MEGRSGPAPDKVSPSGCKTVGGGYPRVSQENLPTDKGKIMRKFPRVPGESELRPKHGWPGSEAPREKPRRLARERRLQAPLGGTVRCPRSGHFRIASGIFRIISRVSELLPENTGTADRRLHPPQRLCPGNAGPAHRRPELDHGLQLIPRYRPGVSLQGYHGSQRIPSYRPGSRAQRWSRAPAAQIMPRTSTSPR